MLGRRPDHYCVCVCVWRLLFPAPPPGRTAASHRALPGQCVLTRSSPVRSAGRSLGYHTPGRQGSN